MSESEANAPETAVAPDATPGGGSQPEAASAPAPASAAAPGRAGAALDFVSDVPLRLTVEVGSTRMPLGEVLQLGQGSIVELDRETQEHADVLVNGRLVARGDLTELDDRLAIRIVEIVPTRERS